MTKSYLGKFFAALGTTALATFTLSAGTFVVTTTADSGNGSLRQAILNANAHGGGNITFYRVGGTIALASSLPAITQSVCISGPGENALTISGSGNASVFTINAGVSGLIYGLTIANGSAAGSLGVISMPAQASGIANAGQMEVRNCVIRNCLNFFSDGGAVFNSGTLQLTDCVIADSGSSGEDAEVDGGAVYNCGSLRMQSCTISNCTATEGAGIFNAGTALVRGCIINECMNDNSDGNGGGIYNFAGTFTLHGCTISDCEGGFEGGGIISLAELIVRDTTITGNSAFEGGGLFLYGGTNLMHNCTVSSNEDVGLGGGGIKNVATLTLRDCTVNGNFSFFGGSGIENLRELAMTNCTVSENACSTPDGGGILNTDVDWDGVTYSNTSLQITACTIALNTAAGANGVGGIDNSGGTVAMEGSIVADNTPTDFGGGLVSQGYDLIENTTGASVTGVLTGNIYGEDPKLGPLQNNGGYTLTMALLPGSPAISAGPAGGQPHFDQRGVPRPQGKADDIGSFEVVNHHVHFVTLTQQGNAMQIGLNGMPGLNYTIQRATSLAGPWVTLTNIATDTQGCGGCCDTSPPSGTAFYRSVFP